MSQGSKWRWWSILLVKTRPPKQLHKLPMWQRRSGPWRELGSFQPAISPQRPYLVIAYGIIPSARIPPFLPVVSQSYVHREVCWGGNILLKIVFFGTRPKLDDDIGWACAAWALAMIVTYFLYCFVSPLYGAGKSTRHSPSTYSLFLRKTSKKASHYFFHLQGHLDQSRSYHTILALNMLPCVAKCTQQ